MNAIAAISAALLRGEVLTIKTAFKDFGITNLPRECGRSIERKFGVRLARVRRFGKTRYNIECSWYEYTINKTPYNQEGIDKMRAYCEKHGSLKPPPKEANKYLQPDLFSLAR